MDVDKVWGALKALNPNDEDSFTSTLANLTTLVKPELPTYVRPDIVRDACALLVAPSEKSVIERIRFLTLQEVKCNEIALALRMLPTLPEQDPDDVIRACRHFRIDMVEAAMSFFTADAVKKDSLEDRISFLQRSKQLSNVEIDEALDRIKIPKLVRPEGFGASNSENKARVEHEARMRVAREFLRSDAVKGASEEDINQTLSKFGLSADAIAEVKKSVIKTETQKSELFARARRFINSDAARMASEEDVKAFLIKEGLDQSEIELLRQEITASRAFVKPAISAAPPQTTALPTQPLLASPPDARVQRAIAFLRNVPRGSGQAESFLKTKGFTDAEINQAVAHVGSGPEDDLLMEQAVKFLQSPQAEGAGSDEALDTFLIRKGLSKAQLDEARHRAQRPRGAPFSASKSAISNVDRAVNFLRSAAARTASREEKIQFLHSKGLSDMEIQQALERIGTDNPILESESLSRNLTSSSTREVESMSRNLHGVSTGQFGFLSPVTCNSAGTGVQWSPPPTEPRAPGLPTMCLTAIDKLANSSLPSLVIKLTAARAVATLLIASKSTLRLPQSVARSWSQALTSRITDVIASLTEQSSTSQIRERVEELLAELLEAGGAGHVIDVFPLTLRFYDAALATVWTQDGLGWQLALSRCGHGHFAARASVTPYSWVRSAYEGVISDRDVASALGAGLLRGSVDFGCGVGAPRVAMTEKTAINTLPERALREALNATALSRATPQQGLSCVYAGKIWLESEKSVKSICSCLFKGALSLDELKETANESLDAGAKRAGEITERSVFKLAASIAQLLVAQCGDGTSVVSEVSEATLQHCQMTYKTTRSSFAVVAQRMVIRTYDEQKSQQSLEESLGTHAALARVFQTGFLVAVVLLETVTQPDASPEYAAQAWGGLASVGFAMVPVGETIKLNAWLEVLCKFGEDRGFERLVEQLSMSRDEVLKGDWVTAAKLEYLLDTGKKILRPGWELKACKRVSAEGETLGKALVFGSSHAFAMLNTRAHSWITDSLKASCSPTAESSPLGTDPEEDSKEEELFTPLVVLMVPSYVGGAAQTFPSATPPSGMAFVVGSVLTSLGSMTDSRAHLVAVLAFSRIVTALEEPLFPQNAATRETKTRADLLSNLAFAALKAMPLPALPPCLDRLEALVEKVRFRDMTHKLVSIGPPRLLSTMFGVISRIDDAPRRATLVMWFLKRIQVGVELVSEDDDNMDRAKL